MIAPKVARVAIVEDDERALHALSESIVAAPDLELLGTARSLREADALLAMTLDVVLLDLRLPDGSALDWLERARARAFSGRVIVLSALSQAAIVVQAIELGAAGYLEKGTLAGDLTELIRTVLTGGAPLSPRVAAHVLARLRESSESAKQAHMPASARTAWAPSLSEREVDLLRSIAKGLSFKEVAVLHGISAHTVADHVKSIYRKLAVNSRGEAVFEARQAGLLGEE